jgi:hypothetical protein
MAKETLVFRRAGFSPALWLLVPAFSLRSAPAWVTPLPSAHYERSPTALIYINTNQARSFGMTFNPDHLRRKNPR